MTKDYTPVTEIPGQGPRGSKLRVCINVIIWRHSTAEATVCLKWPAVLAWG